MKHSLETLMKHHETLAPEKVTVMFHQCFIIKTCKSLILLNPFSANKWLKQRCFTICFMKIAFSGT